MQYRQKVFAHLRARATAMVDIEQMSDSSLTIYFCPDEYREPCPRAPTLIAIFPEMEKALKRRGGTRTKQPEK